MFKIVQTFICANISSHLNRLFLFYIKFFLGFLFRCAVTDYKLTCNHQKTKMCAIIKSEIFKKCASKLGLEKVKMYLKSCRIDACAYRKNIKLLKSVVCAAIEAYAGECARVGVIVSWRSAKLCRKICPCYSY